MDESNTVALAALGILGGAVVTIGWVARYALTKLSQDLREHTKAAQSQTQSNVNLQGAVEKNTKATTAADNYLRDRNGRDSKIHEQLLKSMNELKGAKK